MSLENDTQPEDELDVVSDSESDSNSEGEAETVATNGPLADKPPITVQHGLQDPIYIPAPAQPDVKSCIVCTRKTLKSDRAVEVHCASKVHTRRMTELVAHVRKNSAAGDANVWDVLVSFPPMAKRLKLKEKEMKRKERVARQRLKKASSLPTSTMRAAEKKQLRAERKAKEREAKVLAGSEPFISVGASKKRKTTDKDVVGTPPKKKRKVRDPDEPSTNSGSTQNTSTHRTESGVSAPKTLAKKRRSPRSDRLERLGRSARTLMKGKGKHRAKEGGDGERPRKTPERTAANYDLQIFD
ncbi:hypothetical protein C8F01DRAFT_1120347 [Mycena amicta]|nr:hypothetical protein C8F01DRAFT_1120347 [Mycena amicta]